MLKRTLLLLVIIPNISFAFEWSDFIYNQDQKAKALFNNGKHSDAANTFQNEQWKGSSYYKDKQYDKAYEEFSKDKSSTGYYNQGNALAQSHKYQEAIDAYTKSLELDKNNKDAKHNLEIVKKLLEQDKQNQDKNKDKNQDKKDDKDKQTDNKDKKSDDKSQDNKDKQDSDKKQNEDKNKSDQQNQQNKKPDDKSKEKSDKAADKQENDKKNKSDDKQVNNEQKDANKKPENKETATPPMTPEQKKEQQIKAAISQIPDDPSGLLRNKFMRDYQKQQAGQ
ncbi:MAG: tetratricopeptide repeat protein [Burkholderiales bacterium]|nr:tetratricopeptide repeat protein [Burkholderiales bacterium]